MERDRIEMSQRERDVLKVMSVVLSGKRTQVEAARLLDLSVRQVRRVRRRLEAQGDAGVVHRLRGRPSNRSIDAGTRARAVSVYRERYGDFGPTFAAEKLLVEGVSVSRDTLRRWLMEEGLWKGRRRRPRHRSRRERRECFGELVQADGSPHDWLEGRGEKMTLLVMIDDATSRAVARFYAGETTRGYMDLPGRYLRKHGRMAAMYVDGNSIFRGEAREGCKAPPTQFARALGELGIKLIPAYSAQAKGRVERFNGTAQDRLVKELRLADARTMEEANRVLEDKFLAWFNRRCTVKPVSGNDAHRGIEVSMRLAAILSIHEKRTVANDYTIRHENRTYQILPPPYPGLRGSKVTVELRADDSLHVKFKDRYLKYRVVDARGEGRRAPGGRRREGAPATTVEGRTAAAVRPSTKRPSRGRWRPAPDHPWRQRTISQGKT